MLKAIETVAYPDWLVPLLLGACAVQLGACTALLCVLLKLYLADHEQSKRDHERFPDAVEVSTGEVKGAIQTSKAEVKHEVRMSMPEVQGAIQTSKAKVKREVQTSMPEVQGAIQTSKAEVKSEVEDLNGAFSDLKDEFRSLKGAFWDLKSEVNTYCAEISNVHKLVAGIDGYLRGGRDSGAGSGKSEDVP